MCDEAVGKLVGVADYKSLIGAVGIGCVEFNVVNSLVEKFDYPVVIGSRGVFDLNSQPVRCPAVRVDGIKTRARLELVLIRF